MFLIMAAPSVLNFIRTCAGHAPPKMFRNLWRIGSQITTSNSFVLRILHLCPRQAWLPLPSHGFPQRVSYAMSDRASDSPYIFYDQLSYVCSNQASDAQCAVCLSQIDPGVCLSPFSSGWFDVKALPWSLVQISTVPLSQGNSAGTGHQQTSPVCPNPY